MSDNPLLGYWTCPRGARAEVYQTKKKGRHFYTRCLCCGLGQGTGEKLQQDIWDHAEFIDKSVVVRPSNVAIDALPVNEEVKKVEHEKPAPKPEPVGDFDPSAEPVKPVQAVPEKSGFVRFVPGLVLLVAVGVGAWLN